METTYQAAFDLLSAATTIVILQADNPDGDSLASALALEAIIGDMGKTPIMVCGVDMPAHLRYLDGWDRVQKDIPAKFDAVVLVDANTESLLETLERGRQLSWLKSKPTLVIDHHATADGISFADVSIVETAVSTGEIIYALARETGLSLSIPAMEFIVVSIMSDSLGLTSQGTTVRAIRSIADMVEAGVELAKLEESRRELMKREPELLPYKGQLLQRVEFFADGRIACITIPWKEIEAYSFMYNPSMLVLDDMRMTIGVQVAIAFKLYESGRVTAKIRCNPSGAIANQLAAAFDGGGHSYAAGFKVNKTNDFASVKAACIEKATQLLETLKSEAA